jgi:branched-chain amino acid transport system substrate-binding protein
MGDAPMKWSDDVSHTITGRWTRLGLLALAAGLAAATTACSGSGSDSAGGSGSCSSDGVSASEIQLGAITSLSGANGPSFSPFADGAKARIEEQNAQGGVGGRKLVLSTSDDGSDVGRNLAAARELVEGRDVLGIMEGSSFAQGGGDYLKRQGLAVTGYAINQEFEKNPNFIGYSNIQPGASSSTATTKLWGTYLQQHGATTVYAVGSGTPQGARAATALIASAKSVGLREGVLTTDLPAGTTDYTGEAQKAKQAGVDALALPLTPAQSLAVIAAMRQAGVAPKVSLLLSGYDPAILKSGSSMEGISFVVPFAPFELGLPAHKTFADAMAKYTDNGRSGQFSMAGWLSADLMIAGIKGAGSCPTRDNVLSTIQGLRGYTADGLVPSTDFGPETHGTAPTCGHFVTVKNDAFVPDNAGKPICTADTGPVTF